MLGRLDERSIIQYVVSGIDDTTTNPVIFYEANIMREFREKLNFYPKFKKDFAISRGKENLNHSENETTSENRARSSQAKCYNCERKGHKSSNCPSAVKCFRCNECDQKSSARTKPRSANCAKTGEGGARKIVRVNGKGISAIIDSGTDLPITQVGCTRTKTTQNRGTRSDGVTC